MSHRRNSRLLGPEPSSGCARSCVRRPPFTKKLRANVVTMEERAPESTQGSLGVVRRLTSLMSMAISVPQQGFGPQVARNSQSQVTKAVHCSRDKHPNLSSCWTLWCKFRKDPLGHPRCLAVITHGPHVDKKARARATQTTLTAAGMEANNLLIETKLLIKQTARAETGK